MDGAVSPLFIALAGSLIIVLAYLGINLQERRRYITLWLAGWVLNSTGYVFRIIFGLHECGSVVHALADLTALWSGVLLLWGTLLFSKRKPGSNWLIFFAGMSLWIMAGVPFHFSYAMMAVPAIFTPAFVIILTGITLLRFKEVRGPAKSIAGWTFILWGLHIMDRPFLEPIPWIASPGYILSAALSIVSAISIVCVYLEKLKRELQASEEKYRSIFENALEGIFQSTLEGTYLNANPAFARILGYSSPEELMAEVKDIGRQLYLSPGDRARFMKALDDEGSVEGFKLECVRKDGKRIWVSTNARAVRDGAGKALYYEGTVEDITDRKQAEESLYSANRQLMDLIEFLPDATFVIDNERKVIAWNKAIEEMTGVKKEEMLGKGDHAYAVPFYGKPQPIAIDFLFGGNEDSINEYGSFRKAGHTVYVENYVPMPSQPEGRYLWAVAAPLSDDHGNIIGAIESIRDITEHRRTEKTLRESEERYRTAIESSNDGVAIVKGDHHVYVNRQFLEMFGYDSPQDVLGKPTYLAVHPDDSEKVIEINRRRQRGEPVPGKYEFKGVRKDGSTLYVEVSATRILYQGESATLAYLRDITERKKAEEALLISQARLSEAMNLARIVHWEVDVETDEYIFNDQFYNFYGTTAEREGGYRMSREEHIRRFVHPDDLRLFREQAEKRKRSKEPEFHNSFEHRVIRKDGEVRHIVALVHSIKDAEGRILRLYGTNQDITERKRAEQALEESEEKYRSIFENAVEGIFQSIPEGRFVSVNPAMAAMCGYSSPEEMVNAVIDIASQYYVDAKDRLKFMNALETEGFVQGHEHRIRRKDGSTMWASVSVRIVRDGKGKPLYYEGTNLDITERKNLEEELRQAQKMEAIGTLAGGVAHDFNNILTVIIGLGNLIQMSIGPDDRIRPHIDQIVASSEKAADLTKSLLAFSRKQRIEVTPHDVNTVVASTAKLLKRLLPEDVELKLDLADHSVVAMIDVAQIDQVLMNLATNARDAMPNGGSLTIRTKAVTLDEKFRNVHGFGKPGRYVLLSVSDTGTGMNEETMARIFDPFFTTKEVGKGTGLGLSSAYGIVKQHNGYIVVTSALRRGTTFDIYLPLVDQAVRKEAKPDFDVKGGSETILVIEDDADVRDMMTAILSGKGYTMLNAAGGDEAIRVFSEHKDAISLIILDVVMPGRSGREVLDEISRLNPLVKAIFVSGYTGDVILEKGVQKDKVDFLQKPVSVPKLLEKIREVLDR